MPMKKFESFFKHISLALLCIAVAVVIGVLSIYNIKNKEVDKFIDDSFVVHTTYTDGDFSSDPSLTGGDNYLQELGLFEAPNDSDNFKLFFGNHSGSVGEYTYHLDDKWEGDGFGDGIYGSDERGHAVTNEGRQVNRHFNSNDHSNEYSINFRIVPNLGEDRYGGEANAYYVSAIYIYTSESETFSTSATSLNDNQSVSNKGELTYAFKTLETGDIIFKFEVDQETGELECDLTTRNHTVVNKNIKFEFKISYRDNLTYANYVTEVDPENIISTIIDEGNKYVANNSGSTFSVDDKVSMTVNPASKIVNMIKVGKVKSNGVDYEEWFTIYGGVTAGVGKYSFSEILSDDSDVISINNFALGFKYSENYLEQEGGITYGKFTKTEDICDASENIIGISIQVEDDLIYDHRHKFTICIYNDGKVVVEKVRNECSIKIEASTQYYYLVNLQMVDGEQSVPSNDPYSSIEISSNSTTIDSATGDDIKTVYAGVGESGYLIKLHVDLNENYTWYGNETLDPSCIINGGMSYEELFGGGVRTLTAMSNARKSASLTISLYLLQEDGRTFPLKGSNSIISMGEDSASEMSCPGVSNGGIGMRTFGIPEDEESVDCSYSVVLHKGLEIYKIALNGIETTPDLTILEIKNETVTLEEDVSIIYYVRVIQMTDITVANQFLDEENKKVGELQFLARPNTTDPSTFKIDYIVKYKNTYNNPFPGYEVVYASNSPVREGYRFVGFFDRAAENGEDDNFIDSENNYSFVGLADYTKYPEDVNSASAYYTYLYAKYREAWSNIVLNCVFEPITYRHIIITSPQSTAEDPTPAEISVNCEVTYADNRLYVEINYPYGRLYDRTGRYVAGLTCNGLDNILFTSEVVNETEDGRKYYELAEPWNISATGLTFYVLLEPRTYEGTINVVDISKYYGDEKEEVDNTTKHSIKFAEYFKLSEILGDNHKENKFPGYEFMGYLPFTSFSFGLIEDNTIESMAPAEETFYIDEPDTGTMLPEYYEKLIQVDENRQWLYPRRVWFVPVFKLGTYNIKLVAGENIFFDAHGEVSTVDISVTFNNEATSEFFEDEFVAPFTRLNGYDFTGYVMESEDGSQLPIKVVGVEKILIPGSKSITYKSLDITAESGGWLDNFTYVHNGKTYWGLTKNIILHAQFEKVDFGIKVNGVTPEGESADMSEQMLAIFEKDSDGSVTQVGEDLRYGAFESQATKLNVSNILVLKNVGTEGTYIKKLSIKYNTVFDVDTFDTAYEFTFTCDKNGKMLLTSAYEGLNGLIYYNTADNSFYIDIKQVADSETATIHSTATIQDIAVDIEYEYRTYIVGFQTGAYSLGLEQIVVPPSAEIAYYLVNYKTRNDFMTWKLCDSDGNIDEDFVDVWKDISFKHNYDDITFEIGSLQRQQEIDIIIANESYFFCYWARLDKNGNVEPLSWDWSEGFANTGNSEDGGSLIYYSTFSKIADINVYYYTWDPVAKEETGGYVPTAQKGYFWLRENSPASFKTVNSYEKYKIGNNFYYITGWIWLEDNVSNAGTFVQNDTYYNKKDNIFVDSYTKELLGFDECVADGDYISLLESCSVAYRSGTNTDETKIKIYCYAVYSLYEFETEEKSADEIALKMRVPNDFDGNSYTTGDIYWGAVSAETHKLLIDKYLTLKDIINSGELDVVTFTGQNGKDIISLSDIDSLFDAEHNLLICYYSRDVLSATQKVVVDAICIGTRTVNGFEYGVYNKVGAYADGTLIGVLDEYIQLTGNYMTTYINAVNQMNSKGVNEPEFKKRELILRITLQLLQWDASFDATDSLTKGIKYDESITTVGSDGAQLSVTHCIEQISSQDGGIIKVSSEGFVRLVYALAGYSIDNNAPDNAYGLYGDSALADGSTLVSGGTLNSSLRCGDIIFSENATNRAISIWLYSYKDSDLNEYGVFANCRSTKSDTELVGAGRNTIISDSNLTHNDGVFIHSYEKFANYVN